MFGMAHLRRSARRDGQLSGGSAARGEIAFQLPDIHLAFGQNRTFRSALLCFALVARKPWPTQP
jgi:hypothetical protein